MTGAISGAQVGFEQIPKELLPRCEDSEAILKLSDELYQVHTELQQNNAQRAST